MTVLKILLKAHPYGLQLALLADKTKININTLKGVVQELVMDGVVVCFDKSSGGVGRPGAYYYIPNKKKVGEKYRELNQLEKTPPNLSNLKQTLDEELL